MEKGNIGMENRKILTTTLIQIYFSISTLVHSNLAKCQPLLIVRTIVVLYYRYVVTHFKRTLLVAFWNPIFNHEKLNSLEIKSLYHRREFDN